MIPEVESNDIRHFNRYYTNKLGLLSRYRFDTNLTLTEARILLEISRRGIHTQGALVTELRIDAGYLNRIVTRLYKIGLIEKSKDNSDGRTTLLELTKKGVEEIQAINKASDDDVRALVDGLENSELKDIVSHMRAIERILEGYSNTPVSIEPALSRQDISAARVLMREYIASLNENLSFQNVEAELANLPKGYSAPTGALLIARISTSAQKNSTRPKQGEPTGCVALHRLGDGICEMKRLFVRPEYRGYGIGKSLANRIIEEARKLDYKRMRLDTLNKLDSAVTLYKKLGFVEIQPYNDNPLKGVMFFEKVL